ncbi:MAG: alpha/beta fold hydrolase BchO [Pseudomonadota bacterium]
MEWSEIGDWPLADISRQITGPVHRWHVQEMGDGPLVLLLHGAGGSCHSFRGLIPTIAADFKVVAVDLPGHGFTKLGARQRSSLPAMAQDIYALCKQQGWQPSALIGHSAGAAVALQMARVLRQRVIGLNAALGEFPGLAGLVFPLMAKSLAMMPFATTLFSGAAASPQRIQTLIASTGSTLDTEGYALYRRLVGDKTHVDGTLQMMAQWNLRGLLDSLPTYEGPVDLIVGAQDKTVPPKVSRDTAARMQNATVHVLDGLGHLAHEEAPQKVATLIRNLLAK